MGVSPKHNVNKVIDNNPIDFEQIHKRGGVPQAETCLNCDS